MRRKTLRSLSRALVGGGALPEDLCDRAVRVFGLEGAKELFYLVGYYSLVAITLNAFDVDVPSTT